MQKIFLFGNHQLTDTLRLFLIERFDVLARESLFPNKIEREQFHVFRNVHAEPYCEILNQKTGCVLG